MVPEVKALESKSLAKAPNAHTFITGLTALPSPKLFNSVNVKKSTLGGKKSFPWYFFYPDNRNLASSLEPNSIMADVLVFQLTTVEHGNFL